MSFFGAPGHADCSRETMSCDYLFSRSASAELHERLTWILGENLEAVERVAERVCRRAEQQNECAGNFIAGLYNGVDTLEIAMAESSCATVHLAWSKKDGLSQGWATTTGEKCTD